MGRVRGSKQLEHKFITSNRFQINAILSQHFLVDQESRSIDLKMEYIEAKMEYMDESLREILFPDPLNKTNLYVKLNPV